MVEIPEEINKLLIGSCRCGKKMHIFMEDAECRLWACDPTGCGRLFLEDKHMPAGTWYLAEENTDGSLLKILEDR